jgi:ABC-type Mn2+/Zn2+ transport system permease subunit
MFSKTSLISTVVTAIWGCFGGFLLWGILADPYLKAHPGSAAGVMKEGMPDFPFLIIGCIITGLFFSTIYSKWSRGHHSITEGAQFGILIGVFMGFGNGIIDYSTTNIMDMSAMLLNGAIYIIHFMIMGILASMIYNRFQTTE